MLLAVAIVIAACSGRDRTTPPLASPGLSKLVSLDGRIHAHEMNAKGWSPVLFKEPIQGTTVGNTCAWPNSGELSKKHPGLVVTVGEYDPVTCAGVMYFGDWKNDIERAERRSGPARADTSGGQREPAKRRGKG
jgi:hypothetical protein